MPGLLYLCHASYLILLLACCGFFPAFTLRAQETSPWPGVGIEANVFEGKVIKHTAKFHLPVPELSTGADVAILWKTFGRAEWQQRRRYPTIGVGFTYTNYGIDSIYGRCF